MAPELKLEGVRFRVFRGSELRAFGKAETASLRRDSTRLAAHDLEAILPRSVPPAKLAAPEGEGLLSSGELAASGGVTLTRGTDVARTERARYVPGPGGGRIVGREPIVVEGGAYRLEGKGFTLDPAAGTISMGGGATLVTGKRR